MNLDLNLVKKCVLLALEEDVAGDDITTKSLFSKAFNTECVIKTSSEGIICGLLLAEEVFKALSSDIRFKSDFKDSDAIKKDDIVARISGPSDIILACERTALNFLSHLSGISTLTSEFVNLVKEYDVKITDTRKTIPGLRYLEKYAVYTGGGLNHRMDLSSMFLIKDNHIKLISKDLVYKDVVGKLKYKHPGKQIEVEVDELSCLRQVLESHPDIILLDNMSPGDIKKAVDIKKELSLSDSCIESIKLEASGGISVKSIKEYALTGVDRISVGVLTNSAKALDFSLEIK